MTIEHDDTLSGLLAQAVQQLVETPRANDHPADLDAIILQELSRTARFSGCLASTAITQRKEKRSMSLLVKCSLAASLLIVAGTVTWLGFPGGSHSVYAAFAKRLEQVHSIVYRVQWVDDAGLVNAVAGDGDKVIHVAPSHDRIERSNGSVFVIDTDVKKAIDLNPVTKTALVMNGQQASDMAALARGPMRLLDTLRNHFRVDRTLLKDVKELDAKDIKGIRAKGLRSTIDGEIVEAWIDPATSLPLEVRICLDLPSHLSGSANGAARVWRVLSAFEYDGAVDARLLSVDVPSGFTAIPLPEVSNAKNAAPPSLADVIDVLRFCAKHNDSTFPTSLSINDTPGTCMEIMNRFASAQDEILKSGTDAEKQAAMKAIVEFGSAMGRMTPFLSSLRPENKLHYVGNAVKLGAKDRPILWYLPKGNTQFQVVYADLSVKDVAESALLRLPADTESKSKEPQRILTTSPRVILPESAVKDYGALQGIRKAGKQDEVRFIELQLMPEFMKGKAAADSKEDPATPRFKFLEEFKNLEGLRVDDLSLTEKDLGVIGRCRNLRILSLSGIHIVEAPRGMHRLKGAELRHLSELTNLEVLDLSQSEFSGGLQLLGALPKLHVLIFSSFENVNDVSVAELKELPHVQTLVLAAVYANNPKTSVTDAGLASLKQLPSLRTLYVESHGKWTMPVEKLQVLLPKVNVQPGFQDEPSTDLSPVDPSPTEATKE